MNAFILLVTLDLRHEGPGYNSSVLQSYIYSKQQYYLCSVPPKLEFQAGPSGQQLKKSTGPTKELQFQTF